MASSERGLGLLYESEKVKKKVEKRGKFPTFTKNVMIKMHHPKKEKEKVATNYIFKNFICKRIQWTLQSNT